MNIINKCNAKTTNVPDNLSEDKQFVNTETDAAIVAAALTHFGMSLLNTPVEEVVPRKILAGTERQRRLWFYKQLPGRSSEVPPRNGGNCERTESSKGKGSYI